MGLGATPLADMSRRSPVAASHPKDGGSDWLPTLLLSPVVVVPAALFRCHPPSRVRIARIAGPVLGPEATLIAQLYRFTSGRMPRLSMSKTRAGICDAQHGGMFVLSRAGGKKKKRLIEVVVTPITRGYNCIISLARVPLADLSSVGERWQENISRS